MILQRRQFSKAFKLRVLHEIELGNPLRRPQENTMCIRTRYGNGASYTDQNRRAPSLKTAGFKAMTLTLPPWSGY